MNRDFSWLEPEKSNWDGVEVVYDMTRGNERIILTGNADDVERLRKKIEGYLGDMQERLNKPLSELIQESHWRGIQK